MSGSLPAITIFYDGECPFCVREVRWLLRRNRDHRLAAVDIAAPEFDPSGFGTTREDFMARIHGRRADGTMLTGMQVFREAYAAVGLGWLVAPTGWPLLRACFDLGYRWFARNRVRLGRVFGRRCESGTCGTSVGR